MARMSEFTRYSRRLVAVTLAGATLAGCTTTSFAPPRVQVERKIEAGRVFTCDQLDIGSDRKIDPDIAGSIDLINNFIRAYRCASHEAADGRQIFEVPSMLALIAAGVGPALGLSSDASLVAATGAAVYGRGNSYYAPKEKAAVIDTALDAVLCVKAAAVGFDFFDTSKPAPSLDAARADALEVQAKNLEANLNTQLLASSELTKAAERARLSLAPNVGANGIEALKSLQGVASPGVNIVQLDAAAAYATATAKGTADTLRGVQVELAVLRSRFELPRVHFEMVSTALFSIERVLAQRLSTIGNFDSAGIAAEFAKLGGKEEAAQTKKDDLEAGNAVKSGGVTVSPGTEEFQKEVEQTELELMQVKLQTCVVRAKV